MVEASPAASNAWIEPEISHGALTIAVGGQWVIASAAELFVRLDEITASADEPVTFDLSAVDVLDTAGAWLIYRTARRLRAQGVTVQTKGASADQEMMLRQAQDNDVPFDIEVIEEYSARGVIGDVGAGVVGALSGALSFLSFFGMILTAVGRAIVNPKRLRLAATIHQIETIGIHALPLVGLISFLIGVVIAYQAASVLGDMGAEFLTVDMVTFVVLRELGILLAAIMIVGRSGSAFTAQIGAMVMHEEVDAMRSLALDPIEILVVPRFIALVILMPILTFYADMMALIGAILVVWADLGIEPAVFIERAHEIITGWDVGVGFIKSPVFGMIIALVGCYEGLRVTGSAESVGRQTTKSVVEAIFMILVLDAFFAVFFTTIGV
jgi:phospholipid/cholesterol/gamma-HCH transport system permease protein